MWLLAPLNQLRISIIFFIATIALLYHYHPTNQTYKLQNQKEKQTQIYPENFSVAVHPIDETYTSTKQEEVKQRQINPESFSVPAATTDDLRELAVLKAKQTPGWGNRNENEMYVYAPQEEYERLRFLYDINPPKMPLPFRSILTPETISRLQLDAVDRSTSLPQPYTDDEVIPTLGRFEHVGFILRGIHCIHSHSEKGILVGMFRALLVLGIGPAQLTLTRPMHKSRIEYVGRAMALAEINLDLAPCHHKLRQQDLLGRSGGGTRWAVAIR
eukprot:scaffold13527_cov72-Skeletonema_dohrnii-CCMP3373.AAC.1